MRLSLPRSAPAWLTEPVVRPLARLGVTPNMLTLLGVLGNVGAGALAANGDFLFAGIAVLLASALDMFDGALAPIDGSLRPAEDRPGLGLTLRRADAEPHRVA